MAGSGLRLLRPAVVIALCLALVACVHDDEEPEVAPEPPAEVDEPDEDEEEAPADERLQFTRVQGITTALGWSEFLDQGLDRWQEEVPAIEDVRIESTADDHMQPALWLAPAEADDPAPLLVVLHSWTTEYHQHQSIPFALWAEQHGWAMIAPNFRGVFDGPEAMGSDLAVQDVVDAIDWAADQADIDEERVFAVGFSGGGMMSLLMAGRHPGRFAGAVSFVPVYDIVDFYEYNRDVREDPPPYVEQIQSACGGDPTTDDDAREECLHRSPRGHLDGAREAGIPVYIGHGLQDDIVRPHAPLLAFNQLADEEDRLPDEVIRTAYDNELPDELHGSVEAETYFGGADPDVVFARQSGPVTVVLFEGEHDMVYHPGLEWMVTAARNG
jgi:poly(3-hydroxybutyrate) depolymerase